MNSRSKYACIDFRTIPGTCEHYLFITKVKPTGSPKESEIRCERKKRVIQDNFKGFGLSYCQDGIIVKWNRHLLSQGRLRALILSWKRYVQCKSSSF